MSMCIYVYKMHLCIHVCACTDADVRMAMRFLWQVGACRRQWAYQYAHAYSRAGWCVMNEEGFTFLILHDNSCELPDLSSEMWYEWISGSEWQALPKE